MKRSVKLIALVAFVGSVYGYDASIMTPRLANAQNQEKKALKAKALRDAIASKKFDVAHNIVNGLSRSEIKELLLIEDADDMACGLDMLILTFANPSRLIEMQWGGVSLDARLLIDRELWN